MKYLPPYILQICLCVLGSFVTRIDTQAQLPRAHVYLFDIQLSNEDFTLTNPRQLSSFHPDGYNNQPHFIDDGRLLISSDFKTKGEPRIWVMDPESGRMQLQTPNLSRTYSPCLHPDRERLCMLWLQDTTGPVQRVYCDASPVLPALGNAGYYAWKNKDTIALFLLGEYPKLVLADIHTGEYAIVSTNPGRCFHVDRRGRLIHVHKLSTGTWYLRRYDPRTRKSDILLSTPEGSEDFCLMADDSILMAEGSKLLRMDPDGSTDWHVVADLHVYGLHAITRLAVSKNLQLALVNEHR